MKDWTHISEAMPSVNKFVLVHARYCRPQYAIARWTGDVWVDHDSKSEMPKVEHWTELPETPKR